MSKSGPRSLLYDDSNGPVTVKNASTAPLATDKSLVTVISPNQQAIPITIIPAGATTGLRQGKVSGGGSGDGAKIPIRATAYVEQTSNAQRSVKSSSTNDTSAGTGARTIRLTYYTATFTGPFTETITMNGTTAVDTVSTTICYIEKIEVLTAGSLGFNAGTISLYTTTGGGGSVFASIGFASVITDPNTGDGSTLYAHHYVPTGKTASISTTVCGTDGNQNGIAFLSSRDLSVSGSVDLIVGDFLAIALSNPAVVRTSAIPLHVVGPAIITLNIVPSGNNTNWWGSFDFSEV